jgi:endonuclease YncB( thermonuclease family)
MTAVKLVVPCLLGFAAYLLPAPGRAVPPPTPDQARVESIVDGDTMILGSYSNPFRVRLACVDAPELGQGRAGVAARQALARLVPIGGWVSLLRRSKAIDGTEIAEVLPMGANERANVAMLRSGLAFTDRQTGGNCNDAVWRETEETAKVAKRGVWGSGLGYDLMMPWDYRACVQNGDCR